MSAINIVHTRVEPREWPVFSFSGTFLCRRGIDKRGVIEGFAGALRFPYYSRLNWDSFDECIHDLDWLLPGPVLLRIENSGRLLSLPDPDWSAFRSVLNRVEAEYEAGFLWIELDSKRAFNALSGQSIR